MERKEYVQGKLFGNQDRIERAGHSSISPSRLENLQQVIRKLREKDLNSGHCFMVFDDRLEDDEAFYEYPDGHIRIEKLDKSNIEIPRQVIKKLNKTEVKALRSKHAIIR